MGFRSPDLSVSALSPSEYLIYAPYLSHLRQASHYHSTRNTHGHVGSSIDQSGEYLFVAQVVRRWLVGDLGVDGGLVELTLSRLPSFTSPRIPSGEVLACLRLISHTYAASKDNSVSQSRARRDSWVAPPGTGFGGGDGTTNDVASGRSFSSNSTSTSSTSTSDHRPTPLASGPSSGTTSCSHSDRHQPDSIDDAERNDRMGSSWATVKMPDECVFIQCEPVLPRGRPPAHGSERKTGAGRNGKAHNGETKQGQGRQVNGYGPPKSESNSASVTTVDRTPAGPERATIPLPQPDEKVKRRPSSAVSASESNSTITEPPPSSLPSKSTTTTNLSQENTPTPSPVVITESSASQRKSYPFSDAHPSGFSTTVEPDPIQRRTHERDPLRRRSVAFMDVVDYSATPPASEVADPFVAARRTMSKEGGPNGRGRENRSTSTGSTLTLPGSTSNGIQTISELPRGTFVPSPIPKPIPAAQSSSRRPPFPSFSPPLAREPSSASPSTAATRVIPPAVVPSPSLMMQSALQAAKEAKEEKDGRRNEVQLVPVARIGLEDAPAIAPRRQEEPAPLNTISGGADPPVMALRPAGAKSSTPTHEPAFPPTRNIIQRHLTVINDSGTRPVPTAAARPGLHRRFSQLSTETGGGSSQASTSQPLYSKRSPEETLFLAKAPPAPGSALVTAMLSSGILLVPPKQPSAVFGTLTTNKSSSRRSSLIVTPSTRPGPPPFGDSTSISAEELLTLNKLSRRQSLNSRSSAGLSSALPGEEVNRVGRGMSEKLERRKSGHVPSARGGKAAKGSGLERETIVEEQLEGQERGRRQIDLA